MNTNIVPTIERTEDGSLVVTSQTIAEGADIQHKNVLEMIGKYSDDFESFGELAFETRPGYNNAQVRVALLNEQQATLLMTYQRNTEQVRRFKMALVKAFHSMAQQLVPQVPQTYAEALRAHANEVEARELAEQRAKELEAPARSWSVLAESQGDYSVDEAAKILSRDERITTGRTRLFSFMESLGWIYRYGSRNRWHAYQTQVDNGRLVQKMSAAFLNTRTGEMENPAPTIRVTAKGLEVLHKRILEALEVAP